MKVNIMKSVTFILYVLLIFNYRDFPRHPVNIYDTNRKYTDYQWISDLDSMYGFMRKTHPDLYWKTPQREFDNLIIKVKSEIPYLTDNQIITQLSRLAALVRDGHTVFIGSNLSDKYFPVRIESLSDGFFVTAVSKKYSGLYGSKVVRIGKYRCEEAFEKIGSVTSSDNRYSNLYFSSRNLTMGSFLNGLGIIDTPDSLKLEIEERSGIVRTVYLKGESYPFKDDYTHKWFWYDNAVPDSSFININIDRISNLPLRLKNFEMPYWFQYLDDQNTLYFCFNSCESISSEPFQDFSNKLWNIVETRKPEKLIIDLRNNFGGTNDYLNPLIEGIISHDQLNQKGHLFVMISRKTFSAAMHCASWIEKSTHPVFVGEPTGAPPNHFADPYVYNLPNSGLYLLVSTKYWQNSFPDDKREWIEPEIKVEVDSKEYFNGKDKALECILDNAQKKK